MGTTILVEEYLEQGELLLRYLFQYNWKIKAAFWYQDEDTETWKLYLALPTLSKEEPRDIYLKLINRIRRADNLLIDVFDIVLINSKKEVIKEIKRSINLEKSVLGSYKKLYIAGDNQINGPIICYIVNKIRESIALESL